MRQTNQGEKVKIASILLDKYVNARMSKVLPGLTPKQTMILLKLYEQPDHCLIQKHLEHQLRTSHATTRGIIRRLSQSGMVVTSQVADDRRQIEVHLTNEGFDLVQDKYDQINHVFESADRQMMKGISKEDQHRFAVILEHIINNF